MADTGKIATEGFGAGAIKYVVLEGFTANPTPAINACIVTLGFGTANTHRVALLGFVALAGTSSRVYFIYGGEVLP